MIFPSPTRENQLNSRFKRVRRRAILRRAKRAHEKRLKRFSRGGWRGSPFSVHGLAEQVGHSLVGKRPTGAFSDSTRFPLEGERKQGMDNLRFTSIAKRYATGISFTVRSKIAYRRSPRVRTPAAYFKAHSRPFVTLFSVHGLAEQVGHSLTGKCSTGAFSNSARGWESTNSARRERAVRRTLLCWDCVANAKFMGQLRTKYRFCIAQALSAAVRPAFAVLTCAPGLGFSGFRVCLLL